MSGDLDEILKNNRPQLIEWLRDEYLTLLDQHIIEAKHPRKKPFKNGI
ncbi:hypothetical protein M595_0414 [Lyngbya aestuarii BL J]|uniref:Uncharacterized protein n=1 Tax=Lyngbya aestuarii BL J TaxID=1348334 RepID=U7QNY2_9CYAN|nr:hypothetical protein [Lyngbya aestuarii]ERT09578.1 hypothetical protein M595_0414 [Lyngbya aestuarii BL J]